jgi:hypothetical protein
MAIAFPDSLLITTSRPADAKSLFSTIAERNALPLSLRYKGMIVAVRNPIGQRATYYKLATDDLTIWEEIIHGGASTTIIGDWAPGVDYLLHQPIVRSGRLLRANAAHTSSADFEDDETLWDVIGGGDSSTYIHEQTTASTTWTCVHNLGSIGVSVVIIEEDGGEVVGYIDRAASTANTLIIIFSQPIAGKAYIKS